jgi:hypothetical protein
MNKALINWWTGGAISPLSFSGLQWWYSPDEETYSNDTVLGVSGSTPVNDLGTNAYDLTQSIASARPLFKTDVDGKKTILFDGSNDRLDGELSNFLHEGDFTYVLVFKPSNITSTQCLVNTNNASFTAKGIYIRIESSGVVRVSMGNGTQAVYGLATAGGAITINAWNLLVVRNLTGAGNDLQIFTNGTLRTSAEPAFAYGSGNSAITQTAHGATNSFTQPTIGHFSDFMAYNRGLSDSEITRLTASLPYP